MKALWPYLVPPQRLGERLLVPGLLGPALVFLSAAAFGQAGPPAPPGAEAGPEPPVPAPLEPAPPGAPPPSPPGTADARAPLAESPLVRPKIDLSVPEPTPSVVRKMHNHDSFYLRVSAGAGYRGSSVSSDHESHPGYTLNGAGISLDLLVGGSPSPGLAVGGGLMLETVSDGEVHVDTDRSVGSGSGGWLLVGPFVDGFPMVNGGFHLGGLAGLAGSRTSREGDTDELSGGGFGGAVWVGYGFWVADEWSLGFDLKFDGAFTGDDGQEADLTNSVFGGTLSFSALYH